MSVTYIPLFLLFVAACTAQPHSDKLVNEQRQKRGTTMTSEYIFQEAIATRRFPDADFTLALHMHVRPSLFAKTCLQSYPPDESKCPGYKLYCQTFVTTKKVCHPNIKLPDKPSLYYDAEPSPMRELTYTPNMGPADYYERAITRTGVEVPYLFLKTDEFTYAVLFYSPHCIYRTLISTWLVSLSRGYIDDAVYACRDPTFVRYLPITELRQFINNSKVVVDYNSSRPEGILKLASYTKQQIFVQQCTTHMRALCYVLNSNMDVVLYNCDPQCARSDLFNYDVSWYEKWFVSVSEFFSLDRLVGLCKSFLKWVVTGLLELVQILLSVIAELVPIVLKKLLLVLELVAKAGLVEALIAWCFGWSNYNLFIANLFAIIVLYLKYMVYSDIHMVH